LTSFAEELKATAKDATTVLIVGHSNTSPKLVNLLLDKEMYKDLDESVYNQYWVVKIMGQHKKAKVILY
jgi:phosphohistidine phosphatase SixA